MTLERDAGKARLFRRTCDHESPLDGDCTARHRLYPRCGDGVLDRPRA